MRNKYLNFTLVFMTFLFTACAVVPTPTPQSKVVRLAINLQSLDQNITIAESMRLSREIFTKTEALTKEFELTSPPLWHNFLVNVGVRKKGLCFHWSDALYNHFKKQNYPKFSFHLVGANIGGYFTEHNALVVLSKDGKIEDGILIDPWRDSGNLFFKKVKEDEKYHWLHRIDRGCAR